MSWHLIFWLCQGSKEAMNYFTYAHELIRTDDVIKRRKKSSFIKNDLRREEFNEEKNIPSMPGFVKNFEKFFSRSPALLPPIFSHEFESENASYEITIFFWFVWERRYFLDKGSLSAIHTRYRTLSLVQTCHLCRSRRKKKTFLRSSFPARDFGDARKMFDADSKIRRWDGERAKLGERRRIWWRRLKTFESGDRHSFPDSQMACEKQEFVAGSSTKDPIVYHCDYQHRIAWKIERGIFSNAYTKAQIEFRAAFPYNHKIGWAETSASSVFLLFVSFVFFGGFLWSRAFLQALICSSEL